MTKKMSKEAFSKYWHVFRTIPNRDLEMECFAGLFSAIFIWLHPAQLPERFKKKEVKGGPLILGEKGSMQGYNLASQAGPIAARLCLVRSRAGGSYVSPRHEKNKELIWQENLHFA